MTELDTIYSFDGLSQLHMLLDVKINLLDLETKKIENQTPKNDL